MPPTGAPDLSSGRGEGQPPVPMGSSDAPKIALIETDRARAASVVGGLRAAGWADVVVISETRGLARRMEALAPDIVLIDLDEPSRDVLDALCLAVGARSRPVAMYTDRSDPELTRAAIDAGLSAYVVGGLDPARARAVIETAVARFAAQRALRAELAAAKAALEERKTVDRAKGLLMRARGIDEAEAYALLRRSAMDREMRIVDLARSIVTAAELLG